MQDDGKKVFSLTLTSDDCQSEISKDFVVINGLVPDDIGNWLQGMVDTLLDKTEKF